MEACLEALPLELDQLPGAGHSTCSRLRHEAWKLELGTWKRECPVIFIFVARYRELASTRIPRRVLLEPTLSKLIHARSGAPACSFFNAGFQVTASSAESPQERYMERC